MHFTHRRIELCALCDMRERVMLDSSIDINKVNAKKPFYKPKGLDECKKKTNALSTQFYLVTYIFIKNVLIMSALLQININKYTYNFVTYNCIFSQHTNKYLARRGL